MALYQLDNNGKKIKPGSKKQPARDELGRIHYFYQTTKSAKTKAMNRRFWAKPEEVEKVILSFHNNIPRKAATGLKWRDAFNYWQDGHRQTSSSHLASLERNVRGICEYFKNSKLTIEETTRGMFREWLNHRSKVSATTANESRKIATIAKYCWRELEYLKEQPPFLDVPKFAVQEKPRKPLPIDNLEKYIHATHKHYGAGLQLIIEFMLFSGVRSSEASELPDIPERVSNNTIVVMQKAKGAGKRPANVPVDSYLWDLIGRARKYRHDLIADAKEQIRQARLNAEKLVNDKLRLRRCQTKISTMNKIIFSVKNNNNLFLNSEGKPWNEGSLRRRWKVVCEKAGLEYFMPHELRHTYATLAGEANFNEKYIQAAMRWDDSAMAKRYVHQTSKMAVEVAQSVRSTLAQALNGKPARANKKAATGQKQTMEVPGLAAPFEIKCACGDAILLIPEQTAKENTPKKG